MTRDAYESELDRAELSRSRLSESKWSVQNKSALPSLARSLVQIIIILRWAESRGDGAAPLLLFSPSFALFPSFRYSSNGSCLCLASYTLHTHTHTHTHTQRERERERERESRAEVGREEAEKVGREGHSEIMGGKERRKEEARERGAD